MSTSSAVFLGVNGSSCVLLHSIDAAARNFRVSFQIIPPESWYDERDRIIQPFDLYFGLQRVSFANLSAAFQTVSQTIDFSSGSIVSYPFDIYKGNISVYLDSPSAPDADIEVEMSLVSSYGFEFQANSNADVEIGWRQFELTAQRSGLFKIYPIFIMVSFWVLIVIMIYFASFVGVWHAKRLDPPVLGVRRKSLHFPQINISHSPFESLNRDFSCSRR